MGGPPRGPPPRGPPPRGPPPRGPPPRGAPPQRPVLEITESSTPSTSWTLIDFPAGEDLLREDQAAKAAARLLEDLRRAVLTQRLVKKSRSFRDGSRSTQALRLARPEAPHRAARRREAYLEDRLCPCGKQPVFSSEPQTEILFPHRPPRGAPPRGPPPGAPRGAPPRGAPPRGACAASNFYGSDRREINS